MLARIEGSENPAADSKDIKQMFGDAGKNDQNGETTRLIIRDSFLDENKFSEYFKNIELDLPFSEAKWENTINRTTGTAKDPRQLERVPSGAEFTFEIVYDTYNDGKIDEHLTLLRTAMRLLEGDYIGGSGTRGYGKIVFKNVKATIKNLEDYQSDENNESEYNFGF
jgi:CRISPR-associated protein Csm3